MITFKYMHYKKLLHRDIKPDNFMVDKYGRVFVIGKFLCFAV